MVSGFVTSPDDQSRICLLDASPMRIASKSLMSIKCFFPLSLGSSGCSVFEFHVCEIDGRRLFLLGVLLLLLGHLDLVEITERLVVRKCHLTVLVDALLSFFGLFGCRLPCRRAHRAGRQVDAGLLG